MFNSFVTFSNDDDHPITISLCSIDDGVPSSLLNLEWLNPTSINKFGHFFTHSINDNVHIFIGCGSKGDVTLDTIRMLAGETVNYLTDKGYRDVYFNPEQLKFPSISTEQLVLAWTEGWILRCYTFNSYKSEKSTFKTMLTLDCNYYPFFNQAWGARLEGVRLARDLVNEPANILFPESFSTKIKTIFEPFQHSVDVKVYTKQWLASQQMNGILTVANGSQHDPFFVELSYCTDSSLPLTILIGKGVTFDMGGVNVKVGRDLSEARFDMGGAAAVIGALYSLVASEAESNIKVLIPLVENAIGSKSYLPSTLITYPNALSVQVGNTDAEGRLILADALYYAQQFKASLTIDLATLTGNVGAALGLDLAGTWSNTSIQSLLNISQQSGDFLWQLPLWKNYGKYLQSDYADVNNIPSTPYGGAIIAALFLEKFVDKDTKWIHIDMANTVAKESAHGYYPKGATGFGVRLLYDYIKHAR